MLYTFFVQGAFCKLANMPGFAPSFPVRLQFSFSALQIPGTGRSRAFRRLHSPCLKSPVLCPAPEKQTKNLCKPNKTRPAQKPCQTNFPGRGMCFPSRSPCGTWKEYPAVPGAAAAPPSLGRGPFPASPAKKAAPVGRLSGRRKRRAFFDGTVAARRSAGIVRERRTIPTFAGREEFSPAHMSRTKTDFTGFAPVGANSARLFDSLKCRPGGAAFFKAQSITYGSSAIWRARLMASVSWR